MSDLPMIVTRLDLLETAYQITSDKLQEAQNLIGRLRNQLFISAAENHQHCEIKGTDFTGKIIGYDSLKGQVQVRIGNDVEWYTPDEITLLAIIHADVEADVDIEGWEIKPHEQSTE